MSYYTFFCPHCGTQLNAPLDWVGQEGDCKSCGRAFVAPPPESEQPPSLTGPAKAPPPLSPAAPGPMVMPPRRRSRRTLMLVAAVVVVAGGIAGWHWGWPRLAALLDPHPVVGVARLMVADNPDLRTSRGKESEDRLQDDLVPDGLEVTGFEGESIYDAHGKLIWERLTAYLGGEAASRIPGLGEPGGRRVPEPGTPLEVVSGGGNVLKVRMADGTEAWVPRAGLCSASEFERRKRTGQVPSSLVCVTAAKEGEKECLLYAGTMAKYDITQTDGPGRPSPRAVLTACNLYGLPTCYADAATKTARLGGLISFFGFQANEITRLAPRQALWFDPEAKGGTFKIGGHEFVGDPTVLYLVTKDDKVVNLPIWTRGMK